MHLTRPGMFYTFAGMKRSNAPDAPSHKGIIARNGGPASVGRKINIDPNTVKAWNRLDSIPAAHWQAMSDAGAASLDELAQAAARKATERPQADAA